MDAIIRSVHINGENTPPLFGRKLGKKPVFRNSRVANQNIYVSDFVIHSANLRIVRNISVHSPARKLGGKSRCLLLTAVIVYKNTAAVRRESTGD